MGHRDPPASCLFTLSWDCSACCSLGGPFPSICVPCGWNSCGCLPGGHSRRGCPGGNRSTHLGVVWYVSNRQRVTFPVDCKTCQILHFSLREGLGFQGGVGVGEVRIGEGPTGEDKQILNSPLTGMPIKPQALCTAVPYPQDWRMLSLCCCSFPLWHWSYLLIYLSMQNSNLWTRCRS